MVRQFQHRAGKAGVEIDIRAVRRGWFCSTVHGARLQLSRDISVTVGKLHFVKPAFGQGALVADDTHFALSGSPTALFDEMGRTPEWLGLPITFNKVSVDYEDRLFGRVELHNAMVERAGTGYLVRAGSLSLGPKRWESVIISIEKPKVALKIGIGSTTAQSALIQLTYTPRPGVASEWVLDVVSQPLAPLSRRVGLEPDAAFDASRILSLVSVIVPDNSQLSIRGSLSVLIDGCPKPAWLESTVLIGKTGALSARIEPAMDRARWELTHVEVTLPLFTLNGTGRINLGEYPKFSFDVSGGRTCAQLRAHLPPSKYLEQVETHMRTNAAKNTAKQPQNVEPESAELRLQMELDDSPQGKSNVAWHLKSGCGLKEQTQGSFSDLGLSRSRDGGPASRAQQH